MFPLGCFKLKSELWRQPTWHWGVVAGSLQGLDQLNSKGKQNVSVLASTTAPVPAVRRCGIESARCLGWKRPGGASGAEIPRVAPNHQKKKPTKIQKSPAQNALIIHQRCSSVSPRKSGSRCTPAWEFSSRMVMSRRLSLLVSFLLPMKSGFLMTLGAEAFPSWCSRLTRLFFSPHVMKPVIKLHGLAVTVWAQFMCQSSLNKSFIVAL